MNGPADWLYESLLVLRCQTGDAGALMELAKQVGELRSSDSSEKIRKTEST